MKPHKHAELIKAWADGAEIQLKGRNGEWIDIFPDWQEKCEYRIKPEPKMSPQEKAECDCAEFYDKPCQCLKQKVVKDHIEDLVRCVKLFRSYEMDNTADEMEVAIKELEKAFNLVKPEPKPDWCMYLKRIDEHTWTEYLPTDNIQKGKLKLTFDGETGELKSAEVLK